MVLQSNLLSLNVGNVSALGPDIESVPWGINQRYRRGSVDNYRGATHLKKTKAQRQIGHTCLDIGNHFLKDV